MELGEWFLNNGIYILGALIIGGVVLFLIARYGRTVIATLIPKNWQKEFNDAFAVLSRLIYILSITIVVLILSFFIASRFGIDINPVTSAVGDWFRQHALTILVIILLAYLLNKLSKLIIPTFISRFIKIQGKTKKEKAEVEKRASTLSGFITNALMGIIFLLAFFMILSELGIDIGPLLAGAGVAGLAIGFGAQKIIGDMINGLFIILEDYYGKGDVIKVANISGVVEDVNIRRTVLRDLDGVVHIVPNSEILVASNFTKNWARVNLNISIGYGENIDNAISVINKVGNELAADKYFKTLIITPPQVLRVDNLGNSGIEIKITGETKPMKQWETTGELRKRIKKAFDEAGIEIPWPHTKVYFGNTPSQAEHPQKAKRSVKKAESVKPDPAKKRGQILPP